MADISLTFLGHSAIQIRTGTFEILIDPFLTGNPSASVVAGGVNPTHIILTHGHGDHLGDAEAIAQRTGALVIAPFEVVTYLEERGGKGWAMSTGGACDFEFGRVKFTIAHHGSGGPGGYSMGAACGVLVTIGGKTIYHAGDTALFYDMKLIGERHPIDVALLPIGDNFTMGIEDAAYAVGLLNPKLTIPIHYNTFPAITVDANEFRRLVQSAGHEALILDPGQSHTL